MPKNQILKNVKIPTNDSRGSFNKNVNSFLQSFLQKLTVESTLKNGQKTASFFFN
jgi:hypothetical protein